MRPAGLRMHPEACPGRPRTVRWVVPAGLIPRLGSVRAAPGPLGRMLADGVLEAVVLEEGAVRITCAAGQQWPALGGAVRAALAASLQQRRGWVAGTRATPETTQRPDDAAIRAAAEAALAGPAGHVVRAHGGRVEVASVRDGRVQVVLSGACRGCAAAGSTLHDRLETDIRAREPGLVGLREIGGVPRLAARLRRGIATVADHLR